MNNGSRIFPRLNLFLCVMLFMTSGALANRVELGDLVGDYIVRIRDTLSGELAGDYKISIPNSDTVFFYNAVIHGSPSGSSHKWAGITCLGNCTIVFMGENIIGSFHEDYPGIYVPEGRTLVISGYRVNELDSENNLVPVNGSLTVTGGSRAAGIGGGYKMNCGNIIIKSEQEGSGTIKAIGGKEAAGIGSGFEARSGNITIVEGVNTVEATKGDDAPFSIGGGKNGSTGTITIAGLETADISPETFAYPYPASSIYTVEFYKNDGSGASTSQSVLFNVSQRLKAVPFARRQYVFVGWLGLDVGGNATLYSNEAMVRNLAAVGESVKLFAQWMEFDGDLSKLKRDHVAGNGDVLTGTLDGGYKISIADGESVTLRNANINADGRSRGNFAGITCEGNCTIILEGANVVKGFNENFPGIYVPKGKTLTIEGSGSLSAAGGAYAAGIGAGMNMDCGNISINEGIVNAVGGKYAAGIGLGRIYDERGHHVKYGCGAIIISGGNVNAVGGQNAAAIGFGRIDEESNHANDNQFSCGAITITDGVTQVTATRGEDAPYSIGFGKQEGFYYNVPEYSIGTITIGDITRGMIETTPFVFQTYDVAFASNGGDGSMEKQRLVYDAEPKSLAENSFTREGFDFVGWNTADDGNGVAYDDLAEVQNLTDIAGGMVTLYAQWKRVLKLAAITIVEENNKWHATIDGQYDGKDAVEIAEEIVVNSVTFERTFSTDGYSTIVLPFDVYTDKLTGIDSVLSFGGIVPHEGKKAVGMNVVWERNSGRVKLQANTPYMLKMNESTLGISGPVTLVPTEAAVTAVDGWELRGTYVYTAWPEGDEDLCRVYGFAGSSNDDVSVGEFVKFGGGSWLRPLRAYLINTKVTCDSKVRPAGAAARPVMASIEEELPDHMDVVILGSGTESEEHTTVIGRIDTRTGEFRMLRNYDLKGRNVQGKAKARGAYYGKKVLNK